VIEPAPLASQSAPDVKLVNHSDGSAGGGGDDGGRGGGAITQHTHVHSLVQPPVFVPASSK
jgi:hypothetical protein